MERDGLLALLQFVFLQDENRQGRLGPVDCCGVYSKTKPEEKPQILNIIFKATGSSSAG